MEQLRGQISIDDLLSSVSDVQIREPWKGGYDTILEAAVLQGSGYGDGKIRIFAMMTGGKWPQFRTEWLRKEYGSGGFSMRFAPGWFAEYGPTGMRCRELQRGKQWGYTWRTVLSEIDRQIRADFYLSPEEEKRVERIIMERGGLPYPRARMRYPEDAWEESAGEALPYTHRPEERSRQAMRPRGVRYGRKGSSASEDAGKEDEGHGEV